MRFARVSTEAQDFSRQLRDLKRHTERAGGQVVAEIAERLSATSRTGARLPLARPRLP
ncbi:recombinase family protein [Hymenobacter cheonanensis]|uniref:recombinase family protein n=1 Tax=Hymenobacter sp. CA2-7 TaxID=3063993 RepID=UPI00350EC2B3